MATGSGRQPVSSVALPEFLERAEEGVAEEGVRARRATVPIPGRERGEARCQPGDDRLAAHRGPAS